NPSPSAATSTVNERPPRVTFKVKPPDSGSGPSASPRIPTTPDVQTPRPSRGVGVNERSGLKGIRLRQPTDIQYGSAPNSPGPCGQGNSALSLRFDGRNWAEFPASMPGWGVAFPLFGPAA